MGSPGYFLTASRQDLQTLDDLSQADQATGVSEVPVEDGQIAPGGVVREIADLRVDSPGLTFRREPAGQVAHLFGVGVVREGEFQPPKDFFRTPRAISACSPPSFGAR